MKKKEDKKQYIERKRQEAAQCADIEHKQSQALLHRQALAHRAQQQPALAQQH